MSERQNVLALRELMALPSETEWVEFKETKNERTTPLHNHQ